MKLVKIDFLLDWPVSIEIKNLREYVMANLTDKGEVIRWSIVDVQKSTIAYDIRKLKVQAVLVE